MKNTNLIFNLGEKPFKCKVCDRSFTQKSTVKRHLIVHFGTQDSNQTNPNFNNALNLKKKTKSSRTARLGRKQLRKQLTSLSSNDDKNE